MSDGPLEPLAGGFLAFSAVMLLLVDEFTASDQ